MLTISKSLPNKVSNLLPFPVVKGHLVLSVVKYVSNLSEWSNYLFSSPWRPHLFLLSSTLESFVSPFNRDSVILLARQWRDPWVRIRVLGFVDSGGNAMHPFLGNILLGGTNPFAVDHGHHCPVLGTSWRFWICLCIRRTFLSLLVHLHKSMLVFFGSRQDSYFWSND